eukprot:8070376-Lingulodinium_polyedra.AAC.1
MARTCKACEMQFAAAVESDRNHTSVHAFRTRNTHHANTENWCLHAACDACEMRAATTADRDRNRTIVWRLTNATH